MRLVKQARLFVVDATSEKLYEVDLCVVEGEGGGGRYVVNTRYGKRGSRLREGSYTARPVGQAEAERAFDALVAEKRRKGYREESERVPSPGPVSLPPGRTGPPTASAEESSPSRTPKEAKAHYRGLAVLRRLQAAGTGRRTTRWQLERVIWRAGELRLQAAVPLLVRLLGTASGLRDYCVAWALARIGDTSVVESLVRAWQSAKTAPMAKRMLTEALRLLADEAVRTELMAELLAELPTPIRQAIDHGQVTGLVSVVQTYLATGQAERFELLETMYLIDQGVCREALLALLRTAPLGPNYFQRLRHIFKAAELRQDAEVFGLLAYRFEKEPAASSASHGVAFSRATRAYLLRRVWRTLFRLAQLDDPAYVPLAVGVLMPFCDADAMPEKRRGEKTWDAWAPYWAFNHILRGGGSAFVIDHNRRLFGRDVPARAAKTLPDAPTWEPLFPSLWRQRPAGLMHLLLESDCTPVLTFAATHLRALPAFWPSLDEDVLVLLLGRPHVVVADAAAQIIRARYTAQTLSDRLVLSLLSCASSAGRLLAATWIEARPGRWIGEPGMLWSLLSSAHVENRQLGLRLLNTVGLKPLVVDALLGRLISHLTTLDSDPSGAESEYTQAFVCLLGLSKKALSTQVIVDLIAAKLAFVQGLGVQALEHRPPDSAGISVADFGRVLTALLGSAVLATRQAGLRVLATAKPSVILAHAETISLLSTEVDAALQEAARPVLRQLVRADRGIAQRLLTALLDRLILPENVPGISAQVARILREDFAAELRALPVDRVLALCFAASTEAQALGAERLHGQAQWANDLQVADTVRLANCEVRAVREAAWQIFLAQVPRMQTDPSELSTGLRMLEARWADSREQAQHLVRTHLDGRHLTAEVLIGICDSVRSDVQALGRELVARYFPSERGEHLLLALAEHPSSDLQLFATNYLERYADGNLAVLERLTPYFISSLSRICDARVAKLRCYEFVTRQAHHGEAFARWAVGLLERVCGTVALGDQARAIVGLLQIAQLHPGLAQPLGVREVEVRRVV